MDETPSSKNPDQKPQAKQREGSVPTERAIARWIEADVGPAVSATDLETFIRAGAVFWADPARCRRNLMESYTAAQLLELPPQERFERAIQALLSRVAREGAASNTAANLPQSSDPIFRMAPAQRFVLVALHVGRWSYPRIARVLGGLKVEEVEALAWLARVELNSKGYPSGNPLRTMSCPEYDARRPWTQRFLDEEFPSPRERLFFQNHLMACDTCRATLSRCRDLYYSVEPRIPAPQWMGEFAKRLESASRKALVARSPMNMTVGESLAIYLGRWDARIWLALTVALVIWAWKFGGNA